MRECCLGALTNLCMRALACLGMLRSRGPRSHQTVVLQCDPGPILGSRGASRDSFRIADFTGSPPWRGHYPSTRRYWKKSWKRGNSEEKKSQKKEDPSAQNAKDVAKHGVFFPRFCGSKGRLVKAAGADGSGDMRWPKICTTLQRESNFEVKIPKNWQVQSTP